MSVIPGILKTSSRFLVQNIYRRIHAVFLYAPDHSNCAKLAVDSRIEIIKKWICCFAITLPADSQTLQILMRPAVKTYLMWVSTICSWHSFRYDIDSRSQMITRLSPFWIKSLNAQIRFQAIAKFFHRLTFALNVIFSLFYHFLARITYKWSLHFCVSLNLILLFSCTLVLRSPYISLFKHPINAFPCINRAMLY